MLDVSAYICILREHEIPFEVFDTNAVRDGFEDDVLPNPQGKIVTNLLVVDKDGNEALLTKTSALDVESFVSAHADCGYKVSKFASLEEELNPLDLLDFEHGNKQLLIEKSLLDEQFIMIYTRDMGVVMDVGVPQLVKYLTDMGIKVQPV